MFNDLGQSFATVNSTDSAQFHGPVPGSVRAQEYEVADQLQDYRVSAQRLLTFERTSSGATRIVVPMRTMAWSAAPPRRPRHDGSAHLASTRWTAAVRSVSSIRWNSRRRQYSLNFIHACGTLREAAILAMSQPNS